MTGRIAALTVREAAMTGRGAAVSGRPFRRFLRVFVWSLLALCATSVVSQAAGEAAGQGSSGATTAAAEGRPRGFKTLGLDLLLPGLGHLLAGEKTRGTAYLAAEAGFWTGFGVFRKQGSIRKDSYIEMARLHAGVQRPQGRDDEYYRLLNTWPSSDLYNEYVVARDARDRYPDDLPGRAAYIEAHKIPADEAWSWESQGAWDRYQKKRSDSQQSYRRARNMVGLAVANRLVSVLDAALFLRPSGKPQALHLELMPGAEPLSAELRLRCSLP